MPRIRTIKPEIAAHEGLFDLERETGLPIRFAWCMLFTVCDRDGRFAWRPRTLKAGILPHDELDFSRVLDAWLTRGQVVKYRVLDAWIGWIPTFGRHQVINNRESASDLPPIEDADEVIDHRNQSLIDDFPTREARVPHASPTREVHALGERKEGREGKGTEAREARVDRPVWGDVTGVDPEAMRDWLQHRQTITPPGLREHEQLAAAKILAGMGPPSVQRAGVQTAVANGWKNLRVTDGQQSRPGQTPQPTKADREAANLDELERLKARRADLGIPNFRPPGADETAAAYETAIKLAARDIRPTKSIAMLTAAKAMPK